MSRKLCIQTFINSISGCVVLAFFLLLSGCATLPELSTIERSYKGIIVNVQDVDSIKVLKGQHFSNGQYNETCTTYSSQTDKIKKMAITFRFTDIEPFPFHSTTFMVISSTGTVLWGRRGDWLLCRRKSSQAKCPWVSGSSNIRFLGEGAFWSHIDSGIECTVFIAIPVNQLKGAAVVTQGKTIGLPDNYILLGMLEDHTSL